MNLSESLPLAGLPRALEAWLLGVIMIEVKT